MYFYKLYPLLWLLFLDCLFCSSKPCLKYRSQILSPNSNMHNSNFYNLTFWLIFNEIYILQPCFVNISKGITWLPVLLLLLEIRSMTKKISLWILLSYQQWYSCISTYLFYYHLLSLKIKYYKKKSSSF